MGRGSLGRVVVALALGLALGSVLAVVVRGRPAPPPDRLYVVQKVYWHYGDRSIPFVESDPAGAGFPQAVYTDRAAADADCRALDQKARADIGNPFQYGRGVGRSYPSLADYTSTPTGEFLDWLQAQGIAPPVGQREAWDAHQKAPEARRRFSQESHGAWWSWWEDNSGRWPPEQRERVWDKLDRVRFYEVVEVPAGR
jgi:hypothetical protein